MIRAFSFRYGDNTGKQEWYRVEDDGRDICVRIDKRDGEENTYFAEVTEDFLRQLEEALQRIDIAKWNDFYDITNSPYGGNSWVLHLYFTDGQEVHALGMVEPNADVANPDGFDTGVETIRKIFAKFT